MAYNIDFDPANRILRSRFEERVTDDEFVRFSLTVGNFVALTRPRGGVSDTTAVTSWEVSPEALQIVANRPPGVPPLGRPRVVVAPSSHIFGMMRYFAREAEVTRPNMHVVRTMREALAIFGVRELHFKPIQT
jgi:hypothetical protein